MQNEGIEVVEDTDYLMDNPGDHVWRRNEKLLGGLQICKEKMM